eukprot:COSAG04_NODE_1751_length_5704_cov_7.226952_2_plen_101_part_00
MGATTLAGREWALRGGKTATHGLNPRLSWQNESCVHRGESIRAGIDHFATKKSKSSPSFTSSGGNGERPSGTKKTEPQPDAQHRVHGPMAPRKPAPRALR